MACSISFQVDYECLSNGEVVCISGSIPALGLWSQRGLCPMTQDSRSSSRWTLTVDVPHGSPIDYRYAVCGFLHSGDSKPTTVVHRWETNLTPRRIEAKDTCSTEVDTFGTYGGQSNIEKGWLIGTTEIRLMFDMTLLANITTSITSCPCSMKITAMDTSNSSLIPVLVRNHCFDDFTPRPQGKHGEMTTSNKLITYSTYNLPTGHNVNFKLELYSYEISINSNQHKENEPQLVGQCDLVSSVLSCSVGIVQVCIFRDKGSIVGEIPVNYTVIEPLDISEHLSMEVSYATYWNKYRKALNIGHRGMGRSLKSESLNMDNVELVTIPENTILSFKEAANHGADFVEFDVHVTQDGIPVLYHNFDVSLSVMEPGASSRTNIARLAIMDSTFDQLTVLRKLTPVTSSDGSGTPAFLCEYNQPTDEDDALAFSKLQTALETVPKSLGFDIEIKYPMKTKKSGLEIRSTPMDMNAMVDAILKVVLQYGRERRIVFSAFHPDVCAMIRMKQPRYPVVLCNFGKTDLYESYTDPRSVSVERSILTALSDQILGLSGHCEDYLKDPSLVNTCHNHGLVLICWGEGAVDPQTRETLADIGVDGIIHDRIGDLPKGHKNIFVQEGEQLNMTSRNAAHRE